ncbi:HNH endonuclease [Achromobacter xylosoxidans]|uniref:HNH endonuclease signature motif containing protein n=3 Tax=Bacteria TaxID=2 RepID=UPI000B492C90|nr:HNH endonuclease signature motif containing protein [Achromobacter xylosoxidans]MCM2574533.1 HNH endonuclease [Achromobacter xylosoxidans]WOB75898.1 HNH endonuclease signature motif containing protein [Achromobacter xylosoxidans]
MEITQSIAREALSYSPDTGALAWLPRRRTLFTTDQQWRAWNTRYAGKEAGRIANDGYRKVTMLGGRYQAHRLIWLLVYGCWPAGEIDHINGDPADNRLANLRDVSHQENQRNQRLKSSNTSGFNGVLWDKTTKRWKAYIGGAQRTHVGFFDTPEAAAAARKAAQQRLGFHPNHGDQR